MLETAVSFVPFFLLCYGLVYFISWAHTTISLQFALNETARWAITGQTLPDPVTGLRLGRVESIRLRLSQTLRSRSQSDSDVFLRMCPVENPSCPVESASSAGRHFILMAAKPAQGFFGLGLLQPTASVVIRNEPF